MSKRTSLASKAIERMVARLKLIDEQLIPHPEGMFAFFRDTGVEPFYTSEGQFLGGIEAKWFKKDGRIYKFLIQDGEIFDATSENDVKNESK